MWVLLQVQIYYFCTEKVFFFQFFFETRALKKPFGRMVERTDTGWMTVLETHILENYGIDSDTDVSFLEGGMGERVERVLLV